MVVFLVQLRKEKVYVVGGHGPGCKAGARTNIPGSLTENTHHSFLDE